LLNAQKSENQFYIVNSNQLNLHIISNLSHHYVLTLLQWSVKQILQTQDNDDSRQISEGSRVITLFKPASTA